MIGHFLVSDLANMIIFLPFEVVSRSCEIQLKMGDNWAV